MFLSFLFLLATPDALTEGLQKSKIEPTGLRLVVLQAPKNPNTVEGDWPKPVVVRGTGAGCVRYLRDRGIYVPQNPLIFANTLPVDSTELPPEGKLVLLVTYEGPLGHVSYGKNEGGKLISVIDSIGPHEIPISLYKGYIVV